MTAFVNINGEPIAVTVFGGLPRIKGYPANPGTGPEGKTCRDCRFKVTIRSNSGSKSWIKCELAKKLWTNGQGTDIKAGSPACRLFEAAPSLQPGERQG